MLNSVFGRRKTLSIPELPATRFYYRNKHFHHYYNHKDSIPVRRLLDLSDVSDRLRHEPDVVVAFFCLDVANVALAPKQMQYDAGVVHAICEIHPITIAHMPLSFARAAR